MIIDFIADNFESRSFEPREQAEIIRSAARLQAEYAERMTGSDLEVIAQEVGISSTFVRAAAERVGGRSAVSIPHADFRPAELSHVRVVSGVFLAVQMLAIYNTMHVWIWGFNLKTSPMSGLAIGAAFVLGASRAGLKTGSADLAKWILAKSSVIALVSFVFTCLIHGSFEASWWFSLLVLVLAQTVIAAFACMLGKLVGAVRGRSMQIHSR